MSDNLTFSTNYKPVPVSVKPEKEGWYKVTLEGDVHTEANFKDGDWWHNSKGGDVETWLQPVDDSVVLTREELEDIKFQSYQKGLNDSASPL